MNYSHGFKFAIVALAALSVAWKIAVFSHTTDDSVGRIDDFLKSHAFEVALPEPFLNTGTTVGEASIIRATNSACKLSIVQLTLDGSTQQMIEASFAGAEHRFVVFRGAVYPSAPKYAILEGYVWTRLVKDLGLPAATPPVIAVASNASCNAEALPWSEL